MTTQEAEVILKVNDKQAVDKFEKLEAKAKDLRQKFAEAFRNGDTRGIDSINKELQKVNKQIDNMRVNAANIRAAMQRLDQASPRELQRVIKLINNELNSGRVRRGTKEWDEYVNKLKQVKAELKRVNAEMTTQESRWVKFNNWLNLCQTSLLGFAAAITGVIMAGRKAVNAFAEMDEQMANTRKYTGMSEKDVQKLNESFKAMDTRTPRQKLNELAQEAGRLGKNTLEDVQGYVEAAEIINVALVDLGEGATQTIAKLTNIFGVEKMLGTKEAMLAVGSTVNVLSQNCTASKPYLVEFAQRMAGIGSQAGLTIPEILAFGAVLDANGQKVEMSATAIQKVIMNLANKNHEFAATLGLDANKLNETLKHSAKDGLLMFLEALQKMGKDVGFENATMTLAPAFKDMGLDAARVSQVLSTLAMHLDEVKWQMGNANKAFKEASSATNEYTIFNNTTQASIEKAKKGFNEMAIKLGEQLVPVMRHAITSTSLLMRVMSLLVTFISKNKGMILSLVAAIAAYTLATKMSVIMTKAAAMAEAAYNGILKAKRIGLLALQVAYANLTGQTVKAAAAQKLFSQSLNTNPTGLLISAAALLTGTLISLTQKYNDNKKAMEEARREQAQWKKSIRDVDAGAEEYAANELTRLDLLYKAASDEKRSKEERKKAVEDLQNLYPKYFQQIDAENISIKNLSDNYLKLRESILEAAKAPAAADLGYEKQKEILKLEGEKKLAEEGKKDATERRNRIVRRNKATDKRASSAATSVTGAIAMAGGGTQETYSHESTKKEDAELKAANAAINEKKKKIDELNKANNDLYDAYSKNKNFQKQMNSNNAVTGTTDNSGSVPTLSESKAERKEHEKRAREAAKAEREAEKEAKEALKKDLDERKALYLKEDADNLNRYLTGERDYSAYLAKKEELEKDYTEDVVKIHEKHNKLDIAAWGQALKAKADLQKKQQDEQRKRSLEELEEEHRWNTDDITYQYSDPSSSIYQNKKALNQMLLKEDISYLEKKRDLYVKDSEEWNKIQQQIDGRLRQDQLDKQKELQEAIEKYRQQFGDAGRLAAYRAEIEMLDLIHKKGLIKEEEYQKAVERIRAKYRTENMSDAFKSFDDTFARFAKLFPENFAGMSKIYTEWLNALSDEERAKMTTLLANGFTDTFRHLKGGSTMLLAVLFSTVFPAWHL